MHNPGGLPLQLSARLLTHQQKITFWSAIICFATVLSLAPARSDEAKNSQGLQPIRAYISTGWDILTRSMNECGTVVDTKLAATSVMYLPADFEEPTKLKALQKECKFEVKHLPAVIHQPGEVDANNLNPPGLLYLENRYVVPGGRFNEMYGWDSYFIIRGLVRDGRADLARGMVENFFFEIEHYGNVLNANRSYYLSRSQPPFP
jgi:alpha,alpha-trehalase